MNSSIIINIWFKSPRTLLGYDTEIGEKSKLSRPADWINSQYCFHVCC
jgi:hypothetical protein